jgi:predicted TIM-barrel fold metal-dependent hydrolase
MRRKRKISDSAGKIDVHHHIVPQFYIDFLHDLGVTGAFGLPLPRVKPKEHMRILDELGIATAMASISTPGVYFKNAEFSRKLARRCNDHLRGLMDRYPGRFGGFASLPLPDVEGACLELEHALDELQMDGVVLLSNVEGMYVGDPSYDEVFAEMAKRDVVIYVHPNDPVSPAPSPIDTTVDTGLETSRAVLSLLKSRVFERFPKLRLILSHTGGITPYLARKLAVASLDSSNEPSGNEHHIAKRIKLLSSFYYDTMTACGAAAFSTIKELCDASHILFGTDVVWLPHRLAKLKTATLRRYFSQETFHDITRGNALRLFPRLMEATS